MIDSKLKNALVEIITSNGYLPYSIDVNEHHKDVSLNIVVDKDEPISIEDLEKLSSLLSAKLDELDPFDMAYTLDVSSLGVEKPIDLAALDKEYGHYVYVHLSHPYKGENSLEGYLAKGSDDDHVIISYKVKNRRVDAEIEIKNIDKAHRAIEL